MERLTTYKTECNREMICRYEDCDICEEYCPISQEDNCSCLKEILEKLGAYEDAEEQGLLLRPKVALNSLVYWDSGYWGIIPYKVCDITYSIHGFCYEICAFKDDELLDCQEVVDDDFGKYAFLTREEAEAKLTEMQKG